VTAYRVPAPRPTIWWWAAAAVLGAANVFIYAGVVTLEDDNIELRRSIDVQRALSTRQDAIDDTERRINDLSTLHHMPPEERAAREEQLKQTLRAHLAVVPTHPSRSRSALSQ
jgi:hypothetical protein